MNEKEIIEKVREQVKARIITLIESKFYDGLKELEIDILEEIIQNIKDLI